MKPWYALLAPYKEGVNSAMTLKIPTCTACGAPDPKAVWLDGVELHLADTLRRNSSS
jgi:hypothetical protein